MNRERILFVAALVLLGLLSWRLFSKEAPRAAVRGGTAKELPATLVPPADPVLALGSAGLRRDTFERPSADQPLPLLTLPVPPLQDLPALLPPPWPDPGPSVWSDHLYAQPATLIGTIGEVLDAGAAGDAFEEAPEAVGNAAQQDYAAIYDSLRLDSLSLIWGRILNEDRYDLAPGARIRFQQVNPKTGKEEFTPREWLPTEYESFAFAKTERNRIESEVRQWRQRMGPARAQEMRDYLRGLVLDGLREPVAFRYAEELALALIVSAPDDVQNWMALGEVWERTFALDQAFVLYATLSGETLAGAQAVALPASLPKALGLFSDNPAPHVRMAAVLQLLGRVDLAEQRLRAAVALDARDTDAAIELSLLLLERGQSASSVERLETARRNQAGASHMQSSLRVGLALGRARLATRAWSEALKNFRDTAAAAPRGDPLGIQARCGQISASYLAGDFATAASEAATAVDELGAHPRLLYLRGITQAAAGGAAGEVVRDLRAAAAASPLDAAPAFAALAFWLAQAGADDEAGAMLQQALALDPSLPYARWLTAHWALRDGDLDTAAAGLESLVRQWPECAAALADIGWLLSGAGSNVQADVALRSAEERAPTHARNAGPESRVWADVALRRGLNELALGSTTAARSSFDRALALDPELFAARNGTAIALYLEGDLDAAVAEFSLLQDTLRERPEDPQALFAKHWQTRVETHDKLRQWRDGFDGRRLRPGWDTQTQARVGVEPRLESGTLALRGNHNAKGETRAFRELPAAAFRSAAMDITAGPDHKGDAGAYIALQNRGRESWSFRVHRDRDGNLHWTTVRAGKPAFGQVGHRVAAGQPFRVEFKVDREPAQPVLQVWVDGVIVFAEPVTNLRNPTGQMAVGIFVETANALAVDAALDNLELIYAQQ